jgi:hypothetical protein
LDWPGLVPGFVRELAKCVTGYAAVWLKPFFSSGAADRKAAILIMTPVSVVHHFVHHTHYAMTQGVLVHELMHHW